MEDHQKIHSVQDRLEKLLSALYIQSKSGKEVAADLAEFYLAFSEFHAAYLEHTAEEERVTQPMLWQYFTDEELASHRGRIIAKNPPGTLLIWFRFVIPAQSHGERLALLTGFKMMAPASFFDEGMEVIRQSLTADEFNNLRAALVN